MNRKKLFLASICISISLGLSAQDLVLESIIQKEQQHYSKLLNLASSTVGKEYDVKYHRMNWQVDPAVNYISGSIYTEFEMVSNTSTIEFDLNDNMTVDSVLYHGQNLLFSRANNVLSINVTQALNVGDKDSIEVFYQGTPTSTTGFGAWQATSHSTGPIISTLSEPYGAREWWPCKQSLDDKIDSIDIFIEVPDGNLAASNGLLMSSTSTGINKVLHHWKHRYPITCYLISISVSNYVEFSNYLPMNGGDSLEILNYCYPQSLSQWQNDAQLTVPIMQIFDSLFEAYPFADEKYGHAEWEWGGGMEHQTMSSMGNLNSGLVAHEVAHQWFGDKVTCGSWEDIWLNEGFATYMSGLIHENGLAGGQNQWRAWLSSKISSSTSQTGGSVWVDDTTSVSRIFSGRLSYNKGAMLLHMLRWVIGDNAFFTACQNYLQDSALAFGYARVDDLKYHLEQTSGSNLDEFFNDWYYGQGYPSYNLYLDPLGNGDFELTINQSQSHSSVSFFEMPVEVRFVGVGVDTSIIFNHTVDGQKFNISLPFNVIAYGFDPELWLCAKSSVVLGIEPLAKTEEIKVFPNPADREINIETGDLNVPESGIYLLDNSGRRTNVLIQEDDIKNYTIDVSGLPSGLYLLQIETDSSVISKRVMVK